MDWPDPSVNRNICHKVTGLEGEVYKDDLPCYTRV